MYRRLHCIVPFCDISINAAATTKDMVTKQSSATNAIILIAPRTPPSPNRIRSAATWGTAARNGVAPARMTRFATKEAGTGRMATN